MLSLGSHTSDIGLAELLYVSMEAANYCCVKMGLKL